MIFPYLRYPVRQAGKLAYVFRPVVPVDLAGPAGEIDFYGLMDTGSDDTIIPRCLATELGLDIVGTERSQVTGIGGAKVDVAEAEVEIRLSDGAESVTWNAKVGVIGEQDAGGDFVILGHGSCLEFFVASFDGDRKRLTMLPNRNFPRTRD